jgi:hypothetical protein
LPITALEAAESAGSQSIRFPLTLWIVERLEGRFIVGVFVVLGLVDLFVRMTMPLV